MVLSELLKSTAENTLHTYSAVETFGRFRFI
jgi:hypothetical protein